MPMLARPLDEVAELVRTMAAMINPTGDLAAWHRHRATGRWIAAERLRKSLRLSRANLDRIVADAEEAGFVRRDSSRDEAWIGLEKFAVGVFGLAGGKRRPRPDPGEFAGLDHSNLLGAIASFESTAPPVEAVAWAGGRGVESTWDELLVAEHAGLVSTWPDHPVTPTVSLSPYVAGRLELVLSDDGSIWLDGSRRDPTWTLEGVRIATETDCSAGESAGIFAGTIDPSSPEGYATVADRERAEWIIGKARAEREPAAVARREADRKADARRMRSMSLSERCALALDGVSRVEDEPDPAARLPRPQALLGIRRVWPVEILVDGNPRLWTPDLGPCPECAGRPMDVITLCLVCHRSGIDHLIPHVRADALAQAEATSRRGSRLGRSRRKAARRGKRPAATLRGGLER